MEVERAEFRGLTGETANATFGLIGARFSLVVDVITKRTAPQCPRCDAPSFALGVYRWATLFVGTCLKLPVGMANLMVIGIHRIFPMTATHSQRISQIDLS